MVFMDDIIIYSKKEKEHNVHVKEDLETQNKVGLQLNKEKFIFRRKELEFLAHLVRAC